MQSPRLAGLPTTHHSFSKHRYSEEDLSFPLKLSLPVPAGLPSWASLPTPPMSGTPPPDPPQDSSQLAGRRRKREDTPPSSVQDPTSATTSVSISPFLHRHGDPSAPSRTIESALMPPPLTLPWEQPTNYSQGSTSAYPQFAPPPPSSLLNGNQQTSPKATRKTKAHVASACVNCKRKHLRCDEARPCRRCTQSGKEDTCRDVEHKKRGRPPLKQDGLDSSTSRLVSGGISLPPLAASSNRGGHGPSLVPLLPTPSPVRNMYPAPYAAPSIAPSNAMAHGQFSRPISFPPNRPQIQNLGHGGHMGQSQYGYVTSSRPHHLEPETTQYPNPLFPRQPLMQQIPSNPPTAPYGHASPTTGPYGPNFLQLPPIRPAAPTTNTDPAMAQHQQQQQQKQQQQQQQQQQQHHHHQHPHQLHQQQQQQRHFQPQQTFYGQPTYSLSSTTQPSHSESEERDPKRPRMDIERVLGPR